MNEKNLAFYYPGHLWQDGNAIKNLLLFFDGIAILVPEYKRDEVFVHDPDVSLALADHGLIHPLLADEFIDKEAVQQLGSTMQAIFDTGALDKLDRRKHNFSHISRSRLGFMADEDIAAAILRELVRRGLAEPTRDGLTIPMHEFVRSLLLTLLSQILRAPGRRRGLDLSPITDQVTLHRALWEVLSLPDLPSSASVVATDLATVGVDLDGVPVEEVIAFRTSHGETYKAYARELRGFMRSFGTFSVEDRQQALEDRREGLTDQGALLRLEARKAFGTRSGFALSLLGALWTVTTGDPIAALLTSLSAAATGVVTTTPGQSEAYSYLYQARSLR